MEKEKEFLAYSSESLDNYLNYVNLPESVLNNFIKKKIKPPYYFRLISNSQIYTWVGVKQFTSSESTIEVSKCVIDFLCLDYNNMNLKVLFEDFIPKGKKVTFEPKEKEFFNIPECEGCLETILSNYCILHRNQILEIEILDKKYHIFVKDVEIDWEKVDFEKCKNSEILSFGVIDIKNIDLNVEIHNSWLKDIKSDINHSEFNNDNDDNDDKNNNDDKYENIKEKILSSGNTLSKNSNKFEKIEDIRKARLKYFEERFNTKRIKSEKIKDIDI